MTLDRRSFCRRVAAAPTALALPWLAACGTPAPPVRFYALRDQRPLGEPLPPRRAALGPWELSMRVEMPGTLERDTLQRATGAAGVEPLVGHRWAEPLRDAIPRVLLRDLQGLVGGDRMWAAPAPPEAAVVARLHLMLLAFQVGPEPDRLRLAARWWWVPSAGRRAASAPGPAAAPSPASLPPLLPLPAAAEADLALPLLDGSPDAIAATHRLALWRLARAVVDSASAPPG